MAAAPARRRSRSPRASESRRRSASASSLGSPDGFDGHELGPLQLLACDGRDGGARRQDPGLLQVLGGIDPELLLAQRQQDEGAEQLRVVDAGDGIARRRQAGVADHRFVEAVIAALRDQAVGDLALRGEIRARAAAGGDEQRHDATPRPSSPSSGRRARSPRGSSQARRHHQDRRPRQAQHLVGRRSRLRREQAGAAADAHDEQAVRLLARRGSRARAPVRPATRPCVRPALCACTSRASSASSWPARVVRCAWWSSTSAAHRSSPRASGTTWASVSRAPVRAARPAAACAVAAVVSLKSSAATTCAMASDGPDASSRTMAFAAGGTTSVGVTVSRSTRCVVDPKKRRAAPVWPCVPRTIRLACASAAACENLDVRQPDADIERRGRATTPWTRPTRRGRRAPVGTRPGSPPRRRSSPRPARGAARPRAAVSGRHGHRRRARHLRRTRPHGGRCPPRAGKNPRRIAPTAYETLCEGPVMIQRPCRDRAARRQQRFPDDGTAHVETRDALAAVARVDRGGGDRRLRRAGRLHVRLRPRLFLHDRRPGGLRQLPRHDRAAGRVVARQPSQRGRLQRLPYPGERGRQVRDQGDERLLSFLLLHLRRLPGSHPDDSTQPRHHRSGVPEVSRRDHELDRRPDGPADSRGRSGRPRRLTRGRGFPACAATPPWGTSDDRPAPRPHRRPGRRRRRGRRQRRPRHHRRAQAGSTEPVLPRRRAERRDRRPGGVGPQLPVAVRQLPPDRRSGADPFRRQRSRAADADRRRSAVGGRAVAAGRGSAARRRSGPATPSARTSARSAATPTCSTTRSTPSDSR